MRFEKLSKEQVSEQRKTDMHERALICGRFVCTTKGCSQKTSKTCPWCSTCCTTSGSPCTDHARQARNAAANAASAHLAMRPCPS